MLTNKTLIFKKVTAGVPVAGEHLTVEDRGPFDPSGALPKGGITVSILYASYDPYLRGKMRDPRTKSYSPAFKLDGPIENSVLARVLQSDVSDYKPGDLVVANLPIAEYAAIPSDKLELVRRKVENPYGLKTLGLFLGPLGMPGLTAYSSLHEIGKPQKGETIFVSSAAGAVGQLVGQIAKREGLNVVGSVGSDEKLDFIKELGFDGGFNYKKEKTADALARLAPQGIDIYYDNVGGEQLEVALQAMNVHGRIVACGAISEYNTPPEERKGVKGLSLIIGKRITFRGFLVGDPDFGPKYYKEHQENVQKWLADGSMKAKLSITDGIDHAAEGFIGMLQGKNFGKALLKVKDE